MRWSGGSLRSIKYTSQCLPVVRSFGIMRTLAYLVAGFLETDGLN